MFIIIIPFNLKLLAIATALGGVTVDEILDITGSVTSIEFEKLLQPSISKI